jgi:stress response protein YsnF
MQETSMTDDQEIRLPLVEESVAVATRKVSDGVVRVSIRTETIEDVAVAALEAEKIEITRVPIGREVPSAPAIRTEGDITIVPVLEERLVVETRLFLVEEVHVRRTRTTETIEVPLELRRQKLVVERAADDPQTSET